MIPHLASLARLAVVLAVGSTAHAQAPLPAETAAALRDVESMATAALRERNVPTPAK